jgi:hypothetical protein
MVNMELMILRWPRRSDMLCKNRPGVEGTAEGPVWYGLPELIVLEFKQVLDVKTAHLRNKTGVPCRISMSSHVKESRIRGRQTWPILYKFSLSIGSRLRQPIYTQKSSAQKKSTL